MEIAPHLSLIFFDEINNRAFCGSSIRKPFRARCLVFFKKSNHRAFYGSLDLLIDQTKSRFNPPNPLEDNTNTNTKTQILDPPHSIRSPSTCCKIRQAKITPHSETSEDSSQNTRVKRYYWVKILMRYGRTNTRLLSADTGGGAYLTRGDKFRARILQKLKSREILMGWWRGFGTHKAGNEWRPTSIERRKRYRFAYPSIQALGHHILRTGS